MSVGYTPPTVAALYVETNGVYSGLPGVEVWDESRDARLYAGPWPVVAHPPCAAWSAYSAPRAAIFGLPEGEDGGCFAAALASVREFGGVLEHPAKSKAWRKFGLPRPSARGAWTQTIQGEWVGALDQAAYGHRMRKPTWLYYVGPEPPMPLRSAEPNTGRTVDNVTSSWRNPTPEAFLDELLAMARSAYTTGDCVAVASQEEPSERLSAHQSADLPPSGEAVEAARERVR